MALVSCDLEVKDTEKPSLIPRTAVITENLQGAKAEKACPRVSKMWVSNGIFSLSNGTIALV